MSSDSLALDFEFAAYCPVCDREIPPGQEAVVTSGPAVIPTPALSATAKGKRPAQPIKRTEPTMTTGIGPRRKSSTRINHSLSSKGKSKSHTTLHTLSASTPIVPPASSPELERAVQDPPAPTLLPPSSLYCSEDCRRIDELRSRLAFANLGSSASSSALSRGPSHDSHWSEPSQVSDQVSMMMSRRRSSGISARSNTSNQSDYFSQLQQASTSVPEESPLPALDFSTRRSSRGSEGGYSYRPSLVGRMNESEESGTRPVFGNRSRGSTDSLNSVSADGDERSASHARPQSALSSLRFMTPISPPAPSRTSSVPQHPRPAPLARSNTDYGSAAPKGRLQSPPFPSPRVLSGSSSRSESDPGGGRRHSSSISPVLPSSQSTAGPYSITSSYNVTPRNPARSLSSASLALMGSSLSKLSSTKAVEWGVKRTASTASMSGLVAVGQMSNREERRGRSRAGASPTLNESTSPATSSASNSSFTHSHSSARSTAGSSDYHPHEHRLPPNDDSPPERFARSTSKGRRGVKGGLLMTPSTSSIASSFEPPTFLAAVSRDRKELEKNAQNHVRNLSWGEEKTPTQSLAKGSVDDRTVRRKSGEDGRRLSTTNLVRRPHSAAEQPTQPHSPTPRASSAALRRPPSSPHVSRMNPAITNLQESAKPGMGRRNWSWDHLPVPTYTALDVDRVRRASGLLKEEGGKVEQAKERKRLFYFSDGAE